MWTCELLCDKIQWLNKLKKKRFHYYFYNAINQLSLSNLLNKVQIVFLFKFHHMFRLTYPNGMRVLKEELTLNNLRWCRKGRYYCQGVGVWIICCNVALSCHLTPHGERRRSRGSWHEAVSLSLSIISPAFTGYCDFSLWDGSGRHRRASVDKRIREQLCDAASVGLPETELQRLVEISTFPCCSDSVFLLCLVSPFSHLRHHGGKVDVGPAV